MQSPRDGKLSHMARKKKYKIGDQVVYPQHGVATIQKIEEKDMLGSVQTYLVLELDAGDLTLMVPAASVEEVGLRNLIGKDQVDEVLGILRKTKVTDGADNWSRRFKANSEKLRSGDIQQSIGKKHDQVFGGKVHVRALINCVLEHAQSSLRLA